MNLQHLDRILCYFILSGALAHIVGEALPRRWFVPDRFPYACAAWEREGRVYEKLGIQHWKTLVPDMSRLFHRMTPKRFVQRPDAQSLLLLLQETCVAELVHWLLILFSPLIFLCVDGELGILIFLVYVFWGNLPFILIQRYNRPKLLRLYRRTLQRQEKNSTGGKTDESADTDLQHGRRA